MKYIFFLSDHATNNKALKAHLSNHVHIAAQNAAPQIFREINDRLEKNSVQCRHLDLQEKTEQWVTVNS